MYYEEEKQTPFGYGNLSHYARERFREYYNLRDQLALRVIDYNSEETAVPQGLLDEKAHVTSYHVNVGHGNCSIILLEAGIVYQIWMVDCSIIDKTDHWRNYQANLEAAFQAIKMKLGKSENEPLHINKFFLTHAHHDHYSGIEYLVNHQYIDDKTICYVNQYYQMASKAYNRALAALNNANVKIIEPLVGHSIKGIRFLHPERRIYRSKATIKQSVGKWCIVSNPVNDSSVVVMLKAGGRSMVFPGDLELKGFDNMTKKKSCSPKMFGATYYAISHHGSLNGHPDIPCLNPEPRHPAKPLDCLYVCNMKSVLMGRNGAYSGIFNPVVTSYWNSTGGGLICTEKAPHYVELEWGTGDFWYR